MNINSKAPIKALSLQLNVNLDQVKKSLALAPLYTLLIIFGSLYLFILIQNPSEILNSLQILPIFLSYTAAILIVYFIFTFIFIYSSQLLLIKINHLNFWSIMLSAIVLTVIFSLIVLWLAPVDLAFVSILSVFSMPIALIYWILLLIEHRKNCILNEIKL